MHRTERPRRQTVPITLILDGRPALVVGGGQVGRRKVMSLLDAGAGVELVCPEAVEELSELAAAGRIGWTRREWRAGEQILTYTLADEHLAFNYDRRESQMDFMEPSEVADAVGSLCGYSVAKAVDKPLTDELRQRSAGTRLWRLCILLALAALAAEIVLVKLRK